MKVYAIQHDPCERPFFFATLKEAKQRQMEYSRDARPQVIVYTLRDSSKACWIDALNDWNMGEPKVISPGGVQFESWSG